MGPPAGGEPAEGLLSTLVGTMLSIHNMRPVHQLAGKDGEHFICYAVHALTDSNLRTGAASSWVEHKHDLYESCASCVIVPIVYGHTRRDMKLAHARFLLSPF